MRTFLISLIIFYFSFAQNDNVSLIVGGQLTSFVGGSAEGYKHKTGFVLGGQYSTILMSVSVHYQAFISLKGAHYSKTIDFYGLKKVEFSESLLFLEFPVLAEIQLYKKFKLVTGPILSFHIASFSTKNKYYNNIVEAFNTETSDPLFLQLGYSIGIKYVFDDLICALNYSESISNLFDYHEIDFRSSEISLKLEYPLWEL